jgi:hypothetical protein
MSFNLSPEAPTTTNVISFIAPTDGSLYANSCVASVLNGDPSITLDSNTKTVTVAFSPPRTNIACPEFVLPTSGVDGEMGPLKSGTWAFHILTNSYSFNVAEVPLSLSVQTLINSLQLSWPVSGDTFAVESTESLSSVNWQTMTNVPVVSDNQNVIQTDTGSSTRFFRLHRLLP